MFPTAYPYTTLEEPTIDQLVAEVSQNAKITVKTDTEVARVAGAPGQFNVTFKKTGEKTEWDAPARVTIEEQEQIASGELEDPNKGMKKYTLLNPDGELFGAVVIATGWTPASVNEFEHLGYGTIKAVVTNAEFEKLAKDGKVPARVAFVQSPGGKDTDQDFPYCNSVTSMVALKQANYVVEDNPEDGQAYILYQHMRTPGNTEFFYKAMQSKDGIFMTKGSVTKVEQNASGATVVVENTLWVKICVLKWIWWFWLLVWCRPRLTEQWPTWPTDRDRASVIWICLTAMLTPTLSAFPMRPGAPVCTPVVAYARPKPWRKPLTMPLVRP